VLSARPTRIQAVFEVRHPHPRRVSHPELQQLKEAILAQLGIEAEPAAHGSREAAA
jgi:ABC-type nitrate/sulfonate/bicarbonate transport system ATPase subunit